jgi:hypothetical protein
MNEWSAWRAAQPWSGTGCRHAGTGKQERPDVEQRSEDVEDLGHDHASAMAVSRGSRVARDDPGLGRASSNERLR